MLFCGQVARVQHPRIPSVGCNYFKCFISDPYVEDTTEGWIREEWVEPLNEMGTYYEENMKLVQEKFHSLQTQDSSKPDPKSQEFQNWLRDVRWGRKTWADS